MTGGQRPLHPRPPAALAPVGSGAPGDSRFRRTVGGLLRVTRCATLVAVGLCLTQRQSAAQDTTRAPAAAPGAMSLAQAVRIAVARSEAVQIAQAGITRARGQVMEARAAFFPQLAASGGYTRTLQTQYSAFNKLTAGVDTASTRLSALCAPHIDTLSTPAQRQAA